MLRRNAARQAIVITAVSSDQCREEGGCCSPLRSMHVDVRRLQSKRDQVGKGMNPPFLVIRPARAFWVETCPARDATATLGAFSDGCYAGTWWYDSSGGVRTVLEARLRKHPSFLDRALDRSVAVELRFGPRAQGDLPEAVVRLQEVLHSDNEFCEHLKTPAAEILAQFADARTIADLIAVASRLK